MYRPRNGRASSPEDSEPEGSSDSDSEVSLEQDGAGSQSITASGDAGPAYTNSVHQPGSIVRLRLKNFVTYSSVEFECGPSLNMIIGPNGTGKSTIVCAICLGLGWPPQLLGRAKDVTDYVKNGTREAEIEIELKAAPSHRGKNPVIKRIIRREGNKTSWWINGSSAAKNDVQGLVESMHIQINNLCQFLPQDRVVEFARMPPVQLLEETERAVGTKELCVSHEQLKVLGKEFKTLSQETKSIETRLNSLRERQVQQQGDVDRLNERNSMEAKKKALQIVKPLLEYEEAKTKTLNLKTQKEDAKREVNLLQRDSEPDFMERGILEEYERSINDVHDHRKATVANLQTTLDSLRAKLGEKKDAIADHQRTIEADFQKKSKCDKNIMRLGKELASAEQRLEAGEPARDYAELNDQKRRHYQSIKRLNDETVEATALLKVILAKRENDKNAQVALQKEQKSLQTRDGQQLEKLKKISYDASEAWRWIKDNRKLFEGEVYGPAILTCSIKDSNLASHLSTLLQQQDYTAFTVTSQADYRKLQRNLFGGVLRLKDIAIRTVTQPLSEKRSSFPQALLDRYGFDCWAIDALDGPEPVLAMLCDNQNLHRTPVKYGHLTRDQEEAVKNSQMSQYIAADTCISFKRRAEFGDAGLSTSVRSLRPDNRYWTGGPGENSLNIELEDMIQNLEAKILESSNEVKAFRDGNEKRKNDIKSLESQIRDLDNQKSELQAKEAEYMTLPSKISDYQGKIEMEKNVRQGAHDNIGRLREVNDVILLERAKLAIEFASAATAHRKAVQEYHETRLLVIQTKSELSGLEEDKAEARALLESSSRKLADLVREHRNALKAAKMIGDKIKSLPPLTDEQQDVRVEFMNREDCSLEALQAELTATSNAIDLIDGVNPEVIHRFKEREQEINEKERQLAEKIEIAEQAEFQIARLKGRWQPELEKLVAKIDEAFSYNFQQIGCVGQVRVHPDEAGDFAQWEIRIEVKFRENEPLSVLDSHRQSGGERAVSTIFYLMSLQSIAKAPFRVVDEINQGMDPKNERMVHERMVDIACAENTSQYFLITPKLLTGLTYHPRMVVHTIYSGASMPEDNGKFNIQKMAERALAVRGKRN